MISDRLEKRASTCGLMLLLAAPTVSPGSARCQQAVTFMFSTGHHRPGLSAASLAVQLVPDWKHRASFRLACLNSWAVHTALLPHPEFLMGCSYLWGIAHTHCCPLPSHALACPLESVCRPSLLGSVSPSWQAHPLSIEKLVTLGR